MQGYAQRPEVRIVTKQNEELATDALSIHGYERYKAKDYVLAHAPFIGACGFHFLISEQSPMICYMIVATSSYQDRGRCFEATISNALFLSLGIVNVLGGHVLS